MLMANESFRIYQHYYHTEEELYTAIEEFAYVYNNIIMCVRIPITTIKRLMRHAMGLRKPCSKN